ncbi:lipoxygenase [Crassisporium funariophilum]|nr:lipoxygenase [Crassisporium funariophilum]
MSTSRTLSRISRIGDKCLIGSTMLLNSNRLMGECKEDESVADNLKKKRQLYQWELNDGYPPHCKAVPDQLNADQIFSPARILETLLLVDPTDHPALTVMFEKLAPSSDITTMEALEKYNSDHHGGATLGNMFTAENVGLRSDWYTDAVFAHQQFIGVNPTTITVALADWIQNFTAAANDQGNTAAAELLSTAPAGTLYVQDLSYYRTLLKLNPTDAITSDASLAQAAKLPRYGGASVSLFQLLSTGVLHPLAIVLDYKGNIDPTVSTTIINKRLSPEDSSVDQDSDWPWRYAKMCAQVSDWTNHEITVHLTRTHLIEEAIIVAAQRNFPDSYILFQLLSPHWRTTLSLNALIKLLVEQMMAPLSPFTLSQVLAICNNSYNSFDWVGSYVPADLEKRGFPVDQLDSPAFHNYALRSRYIGHVDRPKENGDSDVASDAYVVGFCAEMQSQAGAQLSQFPTVTTLDALIDMVAMCMHISAPQHTAVNYLQQYYMTFVPNRPSALYAPLPQTLQELQAIGELDVLKALPLQVPQDWLMMGQVPYLLSEEVSADQNIIQYATNAAASDNSLIASAAKILAVDISSLTGTFAANSDAMDDQITKYMVLDPQDLAAAIVI